MPVNARWVMIDGKQKLSVTLPDHQHVTIDRSTAWQLLLFLRYALRTDPPGTPDNGKEEQ
jgi:hypothetical protein